MIAAALMMAFVRPIMRTALDRTGDPVRNRQLAATRVGRSLLIDAAELDRWVQGADWVEHLTADPAIRSNTSVCLQFAERSDPQANAARQKAIVKLLEAEGAAFDIGAYRDAPAGLRIWCGATVDTADIEALGPWLDWAFEEVRNSH